MKKSLILFEKYTREEVFNIFEPKGVKFVSGAGVWGLQGIINIPGTKNYIFYVTYGASQADHEFDEEISEEGILNWQSQPKMDLKNEKIINFINHDSNKNNIYLFLRTKKNVPYVYLGLLEYVSHDKTKECPVYFKWKLLNFDKNKVSRVLNNSLSN